MNARHTDKEGADHTAERHNQCLMTEEWREVHDFIAATPEYRKGLNKAIGGVQNGMWAVALVVLVPFITGMIWIGEINGTIKRQTQDIEKIDTRLQAVEHESSRIRP